MSGAIVLVYKSATWASPEYVEQLVDRLTRHPAIKIVGAAEKESEQQVRFPRDTVQVRLRAKDVVIRGPVRMFEVPPPDIDDDDALMAFISSALGADPAADALAISALSKAAVQWDSPREAIAAADARGLLASVEQLLRAAERWLEGDPPGDVAQSVESDRTILIGALRAPELDLVTITRASVRLSRNLLHTADHAEVADALASLGAKASVADDAATALQQSVDHLAEYADSPGHTVAGAVRASEELETVQSAVSGEDLDYRQPWQPGSPWLKGRLVALTDGIDAALRDKDVAKKVMVRSVLLVSAVASTIAGLLKVLYL